MLLTPPTPAENGGQLPQASAKMVSKGPRTSGTLIIEGVVLDARSLALERRPHRAR